MINEIVIQNLLKKLTEKVLRVEDFTLSEECLVISSTKTQIVELPENNIYVFNQDDIDISNSARISIDSQNNHFIFSKSSFLQKTKNQFIRGYLKVNHIGFAPYTAFTINFIVLTPIGKH